MKFDTMSTAHRIARNLRWGHYSTPYKEHLRLGLKIAHMQNRTLTVIDINWLKNVYEKSHGLASVDLCGITSLAMTERFKMTRSREINIKIHKYVRPRTEKETNEIIGLMIESEIRSRKRPKLD